MNQFAIGDDSGNATSVSVTASDGSRRIEQTCNTSGSNPAAVAGAVVIDCVGDFLGVRSPNMAAGETYRLLPVQAKRVTSQFVKNNNNTLGDITGLSSYDIENGKTYFLQADLYATAVNGTMDMNLAVTLANSTGCTVNVSVWVGASAGSTPGQITGSGSGGQLFIATASGWTAHIRMAGIIRACTNDTTMSIQAAQNTANGNNLTVEANYSTATLTLIP